MGDSSSHAPRSGMDRFRGTLRLPGYHSLAGGSAIRPRSSFSDAPGSSYLRPGFREELQFSSHWDDGHNIPDPSRCGPPPCQPPEVMGSKRKAFFCELGQLDSEVMGHSSASRGSPRNCLVFLTMSSPSGELKSALGSHHSGQSQSERALIHREPQSHH